MSKDGAWSRDGKRCNDCDQEVYYDRKEAIHFHLVPAPKCPAAGRIRDMRAEQAANVRDKRARGY